MIDDFLLQNYFLLVFSDGLTRHRSELGVLIDGTFPFVVCDSKGNMLVSLWAEGLLPIC